MAGRLSKEAITSEFPDYYKTLSRRLYRVLEDIGASTSVRDMMVKNMTTYKILQSATCSIGTRYSKGSAYIFGSSFEGTTTPGLESDVDCVLVSDYLPVVTNTADAQQYLFCLLLVQDSNTPAGYSKLQFLIYGVPLTPAMMPDTFSTLLPLTAATDTEDRMFYIFPHHICILTNAVRHGPAHTFEATPFTAATDIVPAVRCCTWPDCASEWLVRERHYNWPSQEQIDKCKTLRCFFVQVGHPTSDVSHLQWRLSFSLQERLLVTDFNSVQLKCYILLKMIKNEMIHKNLGGKYLTSYQLKTCMLYMIENTPAKFWTDENLLVCLHHCLQQMLMYVEAGVCPNYFIPEENMFDGRVYGQIRIRICEILKLILSADFKFLLIIETDELGIRFQEALDSGISSSRYRQAAPFPIVMSCYAVYEALLFLRSIFYDSCQNTASQTFVLKLHEQKHRLLRSVRVYEHSVTETREAWSLFLPYIDITMMSMQIVEAKRTSASNEFIFNLLTSDRWHAVSLEADPFSAKLKQASALCMLAYCELSLDILRGIQDRLKQKISVCGCYGAGMYSQTWLKMTLPATLECSFEELLHRHFIPCAVYLPAERDLTPPALCYEMDRSVGSPTEGKLHWYDWAVVDGKVLFYFLLYLNHDHLGMEENALADLDNILSLVWTGPTLSHRETAFNIHGWIYKERGRIDLAETYFRLSLAWQPTHNAASLHLQEIT